MGAVLHFSGGRRGRERQPGTRELEILRFVAEGYEDAEIADRLSVEESVVSASIARLLQKLGARTRAHCVTLAFRRGLVR